MKTAVPRKSSRATRGALLAAGTRLFAERGFAGASVEAIARLAGANKAMISYYFRGKEGLYRAILAETLEPVLERTEGLRKVSRPAPERLQAFIFYFAEMVERHPDLPAMILREVLSGGRHLDEKTLRTFLSLFAVVREILEEGVRSRSLRPVDPFLTHLSVIGGLVFFFATHPLRKRLAREGKLPVKLPAPEAYVRHFALLMTQALKRESPARASRTRR